MDMTVIISERDVIPFDIPSLSSYWHLIMSTIDIGGEGAVVLSPFLEVDYIGGSSVTTIVVNVH